MTKTEEDKKKTPKQIKKKNPEKKKEPSERGVGGELLIAARPEEKAFS